jgi:hypothetical protein
MNETSVVLGGDLSMDRIPQVLSSLEPIWDPFAQPCCVHFDLRAATFVWPSVITLLTTAVIRLLQEGF